MTQMGRISTDLINGDGVKLSTFNSQLSTLHSQLPKLTLVNDNSFNSCKFVIINSYIGTYEDFSVI